jgi:MoxR-like ATPase
MTPENAQQKIKEAFDVLCQIRVEPLANPLNPGFASSGVDVEQQLPLLMMAGLLVEGPVLVRDYPGSRLPALCKRLGHLVSLDSGRRFYAELDGSRPLPADFSLREQVGDANVLLVLNAGLLSPALQWQLADLTDPESSEDRKPLFVVVAHDATDASGKGRFGRNFMHRFLMDVTLGRLSEVAERDLLDDTGELKNPSPCFTKVELPRIRKLFREQRISAQHYDRMGRFLQAVSSGGKTVGAISIEASRQFLHVVKATSFLLSAVSGKTVSPDWMQISTLSPIFLAHHVHRKPGGITSPQKILEDALNDSAQDANNKPVEAFQSLSEAYEVIHLLRQRLQSVVVGRDCDGVGGELSTLDLILTAMIAEGHLLLEDYPGSGKSFMAKNLGESIDDDIVEEGFDIQSYKRIQCTPDLLPSDVTGYNSPGGDGSMHFSYGPVFAYVVLLDEINRTTPKVQSAMLEAMAEKQVTVDGKSYDLGDFFFVIATMNPLDKVGTFPLPQAQLDRFLFKRTLPAITKREHLEKIARMVSSEAKGAKIRVSQLVALRKFVHQKIDGKDRIDTTKALDALMILSDNIGRRCLGDPSFQEGAYPEDQLLKAGSRPSPRTLQRCLKALRAWAFIRSGGDNTVEVGPKDIRKIARDILRHRIFPLQPVADAQQFDAQISRIIDSAVLEMLEHDEIKNQL